MDRCCGGHVRTFQPRSETFFPQSGELESVMSGFDDRNIRGLIESAVEERFEKSWATELSLYNPDSDRAIEDYGIFGGYSKMREWIGARQANEVAQKNYEIRNRKFEGTCVIKNDLRNRDKSGLLKTYIDGWVEGTVAYHWEDLVTDLMNAAGTQTCFDGKTFFATDHKFDQETAQRNTLTASEIDALNVGTATAPTPAEIGQAIMSLTAWMLTFKDDKDRYVNANGRNYIVVVSTINLFSSLTQALNGEILTGIVDNPLNGMKMGGFKYKPLFIPSLTSATNKIRIYRTDGVVKPFILQEERGIEYKELAAGSDFEFDNDAIKMGVNTNRGAGLGDWKQAIEGTLS
jgi:phage major head subunit gpT-like protein